MMQWHNHAAGAELHALCHHRNRRAGNGRIRERAPKLMKMPFRRPNGREAMFVREFGSFDQQPILIAPASAIAAKVKKAEIHLLLRAYRRRRCDGLAAEAALVRLNYYFESAGQGPKQFQNGNVERDAGDREPDAWRRADALVHPGEEVYGIPMEHYHSSWLAGGTGSIDDVRRVLRRGAAPKVLFFRQFRRFPEKVVH